MKLSLKFQDQPDHHHQQGHHHPPNPVLLRAKLPISIFGLPFLSGLTTTDPSDLSFSLRTNLPSGPSLKLSYTTTTTTTTTSPPPLSLTLKSGVGLFGSPLNSPLIISAHFTLSPQNANPNPSFSIQFNPQFGDFSLRKTTFSSPPNPNPKPKPNSEEFTSMGFIPLERPIPMTWKELSMESSYKDSIFSGIAVTARTVLPVTKRVAVNFRWGVNFPADIGKKLPFLTVNKIGLERVDEVREVKEVEVKSGERNVADLELLKEMSLLMRRELEVLKERNSELKERLEGLRVGKFGGQEWNYQGHSDGVGKKKTLPVAENCGEFEKWKAKKSGGQDNNGKKELSKKDVGWTSDVESELERAIRAASSQ